MRNVEKGRKFFMLVIGEKLNAFIPAVGRAIKSRDEASLISLAKAQEAAGAAYLDVCAAIDGVPEADTLRWLVHLAEEHTSLPVCLDSPDPAVLTEILPLCRREGIVNSVSMETGKIEMVFPILANTGWKCVALLCSSEGVPDGVEARVALFEQILCKAIEYGISEDRLLIDPIVRTLSTDENAFVTFAECARQIRMRSEHVRIVSGLSNISFGLPARSLVNRAFLVLAMQSGMDAAILDPTDRELVGLLHASEALLGSDEYCMGYIKAFRENRIGPKKDN